MEFFSIDSNIKLTVGNNCMYRGSAIQRMSGKNVEGIPWTLQSPATTSMMGEQLHSVISSISSFRCGQTGGFTQEVYTYDAVKLLKWVQHAIAYRVWAWLATEVNIEQSHGVHKLIPRSNPHALPLEGTHFCIDWLCLADSNGKAEIIL